LRNSRKRKKEVIRINPKRKKEEKGEMK